LQGKAREARCTQSAVWDAPVLAPKGVVQAPAPTVEKACGRGFALLGLDRTAWRCAWVESGAIGLLARDGSN
jgi:hypothetical protein